MNFEKQKRERKLYRSELTRGLVAVGLLAWMTTLSWNLVAITKLDGNHLNQQHLRSPRSLTQNELERRPILPPSIWATRILPSAHHDRALSANVSSLLTQNETARALELCGKFLYSTLERAVHLKNMGEHAYVATGDIESMWIRDSVVQMTIYLKHATHQPWLRLIINGAIRRNAFNILQDPYANAYERSWVNPSTLPLKDRIIGRGGFVATRNYELDSGAYFFHFLYDYFFTEGIYRPDIVLQEIQIFEAVMVMVDVWIVEQHHDEQSPYRYFELSNEGKGSPTGYTGMTWSGFRPSDDPCTYGYLIPANIHAAGALQRVLILNDRVWKSEELRHKASKLLKEIESGICKYGIVDDGSGTSIYAYEVDGLGNVLAKFDDANVPSLLSMPLLGWDGYDKQVYENTRKYLLSKSNSIYYEGREFKGLGSRHTPVDYIWPMAMAIQGLTEDEPDRHVKMAFQLRQLMSSATNDAMHESVHHSNPQLFTRTWFEWVSLMALSIVICVFWSLLKLTPCTTLNRRMHCL